MLAPEAERLGEIHQAGRVATIGRQHDDDVRIRLTQKLRPLDEGASIVRSHHADERRAGGKRAAGHRGSELRVTPQQGDNAHDVTRYHAKHRCLGRA